MRSRSLQRQDILVPYRKIQYVVLHKVFI